MVTANSPTPTRAQVAIHSARTISLLRRRRVLQDQANGGAAPKTLPRRVLAVRRHVEIRLLVLLALQVQTEVRSGEVVEDVVRSHLIPNGVCVMELADRRAARL